MPKGLTFDNDILKLIFNGTAIANIADNAGASPLTNLYLTRVWTTVRLGPRSSMPQQRRH